MEIVKSVVNFIIVILPLLPLVVELTRYFGKKTKNQNIVLLANRAEIIVRALNATDLQLSNPEKKLEAVTRISHYANEVGIKLTPEQASDYIESAVILLKERSEQFAIQ